MTPDGLAAWRGRQAVWGSMHREGFDTTPHPNPVVPIGKEPSGLSAR